MERAKREILLANLKPRRQNVAVRIIKPATVKRWMREHPEASASLMIWLKLAKNYTWKSFHKLRNTVPSADMVRVKSGRPVVVFNIAQNRFRLVAAVHFDCGKLYTLRLLTHNQYDRNQWKNEL